MTVEQLINDLMAIRNKELPVYVRNMRGELDEAMVDECLLGEPGEEEEFILLDCGDPFPETPDED